MTVMPLIKNYRLFIILLICALLSLYRKGYAQLCNGSLGDPVVKIDFGAGTATHAADHQTGITSYTYSSADFPSDGSYTIENTTAGAGTVWWSTTDHTGNTGGYMMVVNASVAKTDYFYKSTVSGLCPGTTFEFAAWVVNLLRSRDISPPDITFTISTTSGTVLQTFSTGTIPLTPSGPVWKQYGTYFTTPAGVSDVVIQMTNNSNGGAPANDLALDDITFRPCGPTMSSSFTATSTGAASTCAGSTQSVGLTSTVSTGYTNPVYQWQVNSGAGYTDIAGATTPNYTVSSPTVAGTYLYRLVSSESANAGSAVCQAASNVLTLTVTSAAAASFTTSGTSCLGDVTTFTDKSAATGVTISAWNWDFGDGQTATTQNPTHTYASAGNFTTTLTITSNGCTSSSQQTSHINAVPKATFTISTPDCETRDVTFTDASTPGEGTITSWAWNFGDGSIASKTANTAFTHQYTTAGSYPVTLTVTSSTGCTSTLAQTVIIHPLPVVDFVLPDVCTSDAAAQFTNKSTIADGSALTYLWTFGDANPTAANPNTSTAQNPSHKYYTAQDYTVSLTVTSKDGCVVTKTATFTVNGDNPTAAFTADPSNTYCSSDSVVFINKATVSFGKITTIKMYWDYNGDQTNVTTYTKDQIYAAGFKLTHYYGLFNTPGLTKTYAVKMFAYSGSATGCSGQSAVTSITIKANPVVTLSSIGTICQETSAVQIVENKNGFTGTGVFSGTGISSTGLFDPSVSGPGTFTITYVFTAANTCGYSTSQIVTVYPTPTANAGANLTLLQGGRIIIPATASGTAPLTYKWTLASGGAATGLDHDDVLNPVVSPNDDIAYTLTVTSANGCMATSSVTITVLKAPVIPNTFTPNGDGVNDSWDIKYIDSYPGCTVDIFNRYGYKLFTSTGYGTAWDGTYNGAALPVGTYYYVINPKNGRQLISGSVTIIR